MLNQDHLALIVTELIETLIIAIYNEWEAFTRILGLRDQNS